MSRSGLRFAWRSLRAARQRVFDVGVLEPEMVSSECRLERLRLDEDEVVEEQTIMVRISSLRELMDVSK